MSDEVRKAREAVWVATEKWKMSGDSRDIAPALDAYGRACELRGAERMDRAWKAGLRPGSYADVADPATVIDRKGGE